MIFTLREYKLKNNEICSIRSAKGSDAEDIIKCRKETTSETDFLLTYPEEVDTDVQKTAEYLEKIEKAANKLFLSVHINGNMAGMCNIVPISERIKVKHRATFGITVKKEFWKMGIGNLLMTEIIENAKKMGYEQIELEVYSDNRRALNLYEKFGFEKWGCIPNGYKLKDQTYNNCIKMGKIL
ncbi:MAG: GNAT family N-acetyltransferase [Leptotrichiaceae bacterium]|nr:GNAT family N-acetyltransferase [Leptotrichiaceae bacterium]